MSNNYADFPSCETSMMDKVVLHNHTYWKNLCQTRVAKTTFKEINTNTGYSEHGLERVYINPQRGTNNSNNSV